MKLKLFLGFVAAMSYSAVYGADAPVVQPHEHGATCNHDHAAEAGEHKHEHGEACNHSHAHGDSCSGHDHSNCGGDTPVLVTADAHARHISAMKIEEVPAAGMALTHSMYGHLFVPSHALETYSLPCGGRISLYVKSAQEVKKGDILYTVVAPEVSALVADIRKEEAGITRCGEEISSISQRLERLKAAGSSNSDLEAQLNFKNAEKRQLERELEVTRTKLNILVMGAEIKPENGMPTLVVRANKDGIVRNVGITQGSWGEQGAAVVTMSNLSAMEIEGTLYGNNVPDFSTVRATRLTGRDNQVMEGTWRMAEQVDEDKQTRAFYFTPAALPADARPGQLCRVDFYDNGGYGMGEDFSGMLILLDMNNRVMWLSTGGVMIDYITDAREESILDRAYVCRSLHHCHMFRYLRPN